VMTPARYRNKSGMYNKEMDFLRCNTELFGESSWIKDIVAREIENWEILRKNPHPDICYYQSVNYDTSNAVTGLLFDKYDMSLNYIFKQS
jgi:hypothetical protein